MHVRIVPRLHVMKGGSSSTGAAVVWFTAEKLSGLRLPTCKLWGTLATLGSC